jgi:class 3 adenylate cyclase
MFTDVVSFSARVQENEGLTLRLVQRDFKAITSACTSCGGQVLKTTGDGLLMSFPTAGAAVDCALKVQGMVVHASKTLPPEQILQHRIGIHLGDVFVTDQDVMGNDVNVAARVLSEAGAGEICVSQTVYDIVKHRLSIKGVYLGERELKNIREPVPIFLLPVNEAQSHAPAQKSATRKRNRWPLVVGTLGILAGAAFCAWRFMPRDNNSVLPLATTAQPAIAPTTQPRAAAKFIDFTRQAGGNWKGKYGRLSAIVFGEDAMMVPGHAFPITLEPSLKAELSLLECTIIHYPNIERSAGESLPFRAYSTTRIAAAIITENSMSLHLKLPDQKPRRMTLYALNYSPNGRALPRVESVWLRDARTDEPLVNTTLSAFQEGLYATFQVAGDIMIIVKREQGPNAVLSAVFLDPAE